MLLIFLIFLFTKVAATLVSAYYAYRLMRHPLTPSRTWVFLFWGFLMIMASQLQTLWYIPEAMAYQARHQGLFLILDNIWTTGARLLIMYGTARIFTRIEMKAKLLDVKQ